jgi:hypothetical protein
MSKDILTRLPFSKKQLQHSITDQHKLKTPYNNGEHEEPL